MEVKLKKGTIVTCKHPSGTFWEFDDTIIFTDKSGDNEQYSYGTDGQKCYFPKDSSLGSFGLPEDMFDIK